MGVWMNAGRALESDESTFYSWNYHLKLECLGLWSPALSALLRTSFLIQALTSKNH
jgi:hypothetical protein